MDIRLGGPQHDASVAFLLDHRVDGRLSFDLGGHHREGRVGRRSRALGQSGDNENLTSGRCGRLGVLDDCALWLTERRFDRIAALPEKL